MSKKLAFAMALVAFAAACAPQPEPQPQFDSQPITNEPVFQGKYGAN